MCYIFLQSCDHIALQFRCHKRSANFPCERKGDKKEGRSRSQLGRLSPTLKFKLRVAIYQLTIWTILQQLHDWFQHLKKRISLPRALRELTPVNLPRGSRRCDNTCW